MMSSSMYHPPPHHGLSAPKSPTTSGEWGKLLEPFPSPSPVNGESAWFLRGHPQSPAEPGSRHTSAGVGCQGLLASPVRSPTPHGSKKSAQEGAPPPCFLPPPAAVKSKSEVKDFYYSTDTSEKRSN